MDMVEQGKFQLAFDYVRLILFILDWYSSLDSSMEDSSPHTRLAVLNQSRKRRLRRHPHPPHLCLRA
jgi:hypothetical protein